MTASLIILSFKRSLDHHRKAINTTPELFMKQYWEGPADGLFLVRDPRLSEGSTGFLQTESDGSLKIIFIIAGEIDHI